MPQEQRLSVGRDSLDPFGTESKPPIDRNYRYSSTNGYDRSTGPQTLSYLPSSAIGQTRDVSSIGNSGAVNYRQVLSSNKYSSSQKYEPVRATHFREEQALDLRPLDSSTYVAYASNTKFDNTGSTFVSSTGRGASADYNRYIPTSNINRIQSIDKSIGPAVVETSTFARSGFLENSQCDYKQTRQGISYYKDMLERIKKEDVEVRQKKEQLDREYELKREKAKLYKVEDQKVDYLAMLKSTISQSRSKSSQYQPLRQDYSSTYSALPARLAF